MAEQNAEQLAQQIAEAVSQAVRQAAAESSRQVIDASRTARSQEVGAESEFETGMDEFFKSQSQINAANVKRTADEYQDIALSVARNLNAITQKTFSDSQNLTAQLMQNAIENANLAAKQAIRHSDIAIDREWNVDEVAQAVAKTAVFSDALAAAVARAFGKSDDE